MRLSIILAVVSTLLLVSVSAGASNGQELPTTADFQPPDVPCPAGSLPEPPPITGKLPAAATTCAPVADVRGSPVTGGVEDTSPPQGHFAQATGALDDPIPNPGWFITKTRFKDNVLPVTYSGTFSTYMEVYPDYVPDEFEGYTGGVYLTATNRVHHAVEFIARYRPVDTAGMIQIFDWSCTPNYPCYDEDDQPKTSNAFVWDAWLPEVPCWYKMLDDNTGHYVNYLYYRNSTFNIGGDMWRNAVSIWNWCNNVYDGVYSHDFVPEVEPPATGPMVDCSLPFPEDPFGCGDFAGSIELWDHTQPPTVAKQGFHHQQLDYDGQTSYLGPDVTDFVNYSGPIWQLYYLNPNNIWEVGTYQDDDGDDFPNVSVPGNDKPADQDIDGDGGPNVTEVFCGADAPPGKTEAWDPYILEERLDNQFAGVDDDGDTLVDEPLPAGVGVFDCDGDGYNGNAEANVFQQMASGRDQDPCGTNAWPADLVSGSIPDSTNRVNIADINSFFAPVRRLDTSPGDPGFNVRWDIVPGPGIFAEVINIGDLSSLLTVKPPMLNGVVANNGPSCPWPP